MRFTGNDHARVAQAIAARAKAEHAQGKPYKINVWTGASTAAECDGVMAEAHALGQRLPFNTDPIARKAVNAGEIDFIDMPEILRGKYQYYTKADVEKLRATGYTRAMTPLPEAVRDYVQNYLVAGKKLGE